jgi:hypothetical protein
MGDMAAERHAKQEEERVNEIMKHHLSLEQFVEE